MQKLLLIDDMPEVIETIGDFLEDHYEVTCFSEYEKLKEYIHSHAGELDIILCDYKMPIKNGLEVLTEIKELNPTTVRILFTGYTDVESFESSEVVHAVIQKTSFTRINDLIKKVEEIVRSVKENS